MVIDGKKIADEILAELKRGVLELNEKIRLAIVKVGDDLVSQKFIEQKKIFADKAGIEVKEYDFPESISTDDLRKKIAGIVHKKQTSGVIIQLPLPEHINVQYILNSVPPEKDVDTLSARSVGNFAVGKSTIEPPIVLAIKEIFKRYKVDFVGKNIVVVGAGRLVGKPIAQWFLNEGLTFSVVEKNTKDPKSHTLMADILISGVGKPNLITADMVKEGAVVVDCGTSVEPSDKGANINDKLSGDVDFDSVSQKAFLITPVPGGVGPVTAAMIFKNLIALSK